MPVCLSGGPHYKRALRHVPGFVLGAAQPVAVCSCHRPRGLSPHSPPRTGENCQGHQTIVRTHLLSSPLLPESVCFWGLPRCPPQPPDQRVYHMPVTFLANRKVNQRCRVFSNQAVPSDVFSYPQYQHRQAVYLRFQNFYYYAFLIGVCFLINALFISSVVLLLFKRSGSLYEETIVHFVSICQTFQ